MKVQLFIPLVVDQCAPELGFQVIKLLENISCEVIVPSSQTSSGEELYSKGDWLDSREIAEKFLNDFDSSLPIIVPSVEASSFIKHQMGDMLANSSLHLKYKDIAGQVYELSEFLVDHLNIDHFNANVEEKVILHYSCSYSITDNKAECIDNIMSKVKGLEVVQANHVCAWKESIFIEAELADQLGMLLIKEAEELACDRIITNEPYCFINLSQLIGQKKSNLKISYFPEILI